MQFQYFIDQSNPKHNEYLMSLNESCCLTKEGLPNLFKLATKKQNYDSITKFQECWVAKLSWAKLCLKVDGNLHIIKCKIYS
jgi:hypothetical protein